MTSYTRQHIEEVPHKRHRAYMPAGVRAVLQRYPNAAVAGLWLILPHLLYAFLWWGDSPKTLGNDYIEYQPGQQLLLLQSIRDGYFPLWAPAESGGMPFANYMFTGQYSPIAWLFLGWDAIFQGHQLTILTHLRLLALSMSGFFAYLVMRRLNLPTLAAGLGGAIFIFNFRVLDAFRFGMALDAVVWLPVLLYCIERMILRPSLVSALPATLVQYMMLIAGHTQEAAYCLCFGGLYFIVRTLVLLPHDLPNRRWRWVVSRFVCFAGVQLLVLGLWSVMVIPIVRDVLPMWTWRTTANPDFAYLSQLTWPRLLYNVFYPWFVDVNSAFYCAQMAWILVAISALHLLFRRNHIRRQDRQMLTFFFAVLLCCLLYALGSLTPVARMVDAVVPVFKMFRSPGRMMSVGMFAMAAICAYGIRVLCDGLHNDRAIFRTAAVGCMVFLSAGVALAAGWATDAIDVREHHVSVPIFWNVSNWSPAELHDATRMIPQMAGLIIAVAVVNLAMFTLTRRRRITNTVMVASVMVVLLIEAGVYHRRGTWLVDGRVQTPMADRFKEADIYHTRVYTELPFFVRNTDPVRRDGPSNHLRLWESTPVQLREVLLRGGAPGWNLYFQNVPGREIPRAYVTPSVRLVQGDDLAAIAEMNPYATSIVDLTDAVNARARTDEHLAALNRRLGKAHAEAARTTFEELNRSVELKIYTFNRAAFSIATATGGLFNYIDGFAEGWKATIDDEPVTIYRSNHMFKAVVLPPGHHRVEFVYDPPSFRIGLLISLASWCLLSALGASCLVTVPRRRILLAVLAFGLAAVGARQVHSRVYEMAWREGRINYDPDQPRAAVPDYVTAAAGHAITTR